MSASDRSERDEQWLRQIRAGNEGAFEHLFLSYYEELCRYAAGYVATDAVEDLVQDLFVTLWERRHEMNPEWDVRAYLYTAARNRALKHLDHRGVRRRHRETSEVPPRPEGPEAVLRRRELEDAIRKALDALPERRREIFMLSRKRGLTYAEIAEVLDISVKTVETQIGRALRAMEKHLTNFLMLLM